MCIEIIDNSFPGNLKLNDILVAKDGNLYLVTKGELADHPYKISNLVTHQTISNLKRLDNCVTRKGHMLNIGYLEKIIDSNHCRINITIEYEEASL